MGSNGLELGEGLVEEARFGGGLREGNEGKAGSFGVLAVKEEMVELIDFREHLGAAEDLGDGGDGLWGGI